MSDTFKKPAFDESHSLPEWIHHNSQHSPEHPFFAYQSSETGITNITYFQANNGIAKAAQIVSSVLSKLSEDTSNPPSPIISVLANMDFITYNTLLLGILKIGGTAFLISPRNSPVAVSYLLKETGSRQLFVSADEPIQRLAALSESAVKISGREVQLIPAPTFQDFFGDDTTNVGVDPQSKYPKNAMSSPAVILHSSGSTSFPKVIPISHRLVLQWARATKSIGLDLSKHRLAAHSLPAFHASGFLTMIWAAHTGLVLTVFPPQAPPIVPSPSNLLEAVLASHSTFLVCVPFFVELWSRNTSDVAKLKQLHGIVYGGGPLSKSIGDELSQAGVSLIGQYGATEIGFCTVIERREDDLEWDWLKLSPDYDIGFLPQESSSGLFELICVTSPVHTPAIINWDSDGREAFATNDLVIRHPTDPKKFKVFGRKDDQIMLSTGEKTNPTPIEVIICRDPRVDAAVMFGRGQPQNGILIQPVKGHEIDPTDEAALAQFRNSIWHSVEQANSFAPSHSRLYKEMILIAHPLKPFEMTAKLAPRRPVVLESYSEEIQEAYEKVTSSSQTDIAPPTLWAPSEILQFVRNVVHKVTSKQILDHDDIFQQGGDSLQATYIRNSMIRVLRQTQQYDPERPVSQGFVYVNPTIASISTQILAHTKSTVAVGDEVTSKLKELKDMISEFSLDFPVHKRAMPHKRPPGDVVLLTGSTGSLGTELLSYLVSLSDVFHVYAVNRPSSSGTKTLRERQIEALVDRGLLPSVLDSPKVTLVEADTSAPALGMVLPLYSEIRDSITLIIHSAWRLDFNLTLRSFKPMVRGVRNLVNLALLSPQKDPPRIILMGSAGVFRNWKPSGQPLEAPIEDPAVVIGSGYIESKWVAERILEEAAKSTQLRPIIFRIGQLSSNFSGVWNTGDWVPAIVRSGQVLGVLPARNDSIAWIPLDTAAQAIVDLRTSDSQYLHLRHPYPVPWNTVFQAFSTSLNVPLVDWPQWLSGLEKDTTAPQRNPARHLLEFFRGCSPNSMKNRDALGVPLLDIKETLHHYPTLTQLSQTRPDDAVRWVEYWKRKGFLVE